ncbi:unnamed protein product [Cyprideis torosa]|uniref:Uncharacterized protein n=1 Tax=Cyprideis torosa TaxID=163714 RepID=A0A7R8ZKK0_9CRUS|nr:unnamed protein product [Cyprideis torosa]CAG0889562.1 unnamed protein product [Cyprideis torosa]
MGMKMFQKSFNSSAKVYQENNHYCLSEHPDSDCWSSISSQKRITSKLRILISPPKHCGPLEVESALVLFPSSSLNSENRDLQGSTPEWDLRWRVISGDQVKWTQGDILCCVARVALPVFPAILGSSINAVLHVLLNDDPVVFAPIRLTLEDFIQKKYHLKTEGPSDVRTCSLNPSRDRFTPPTPPAFGVNINQPAHCSPASISAAVLWLLHVVPQYRPDVEACGEPETIQTLLQALKAELQFIQEGLSSLTANEEPPAKRRGGQPFD